MIRKAFRTDVASLFACLTILWACGAGLALDPGKQSQDEVARKLAQNAQEIASITAKLQAHDPGIAGSENFNVLAPPNQGFLAKQVLTKAEQLRKEIALAWLGRELAAGEAFTGINVKLANGDDEGLTMLTKGGPHWMWLRTTRERALGTTLAHELTHVVLSARFPNGMPAWANEGIASLADDAGRFAKRKQIMKEFQAKGFPALGPVLTKQAIHPSDETCYALSVSLTEFFLSRGDRQTLLRFVAEGHRAGWDTALNQVYGIRTTNELQQQWESWARQPQL